VPKLAALLALTAATLVVAGPGSAPAASARQAGAPYSVLQMNLCLSGGAGCYPRTAYPAVVDEAAAQVLDHGAEAVTLNEACSADAAELARRTGYHLRFAAVLVRGARIPCVSPRHRGAFGIAVLTKGPIRSSRDQAFAVHAGLEERRWICATTGRAITVCTAHLGTRGSVEARRANDGECAELQGVLTRYDRAGTTVFGGDVNRRAPCAPAAMWVTGDTAAGQVPGIQHVYGSTTLHDPVARVAAATYTDHDFLLTAGSLGPARALPPRPARTLEPRSRQPVGGVNWLAVNTAPCGSRTTASRVQSESVLATTAPPSRSAAAAVSSRSATVKPTCQCGSSSGPTRPSQPMASANPGGAATSACRERMSGSTVACR